MDRPLDLAAITTDLLAAFAGLGHEGRRAVSANLHQAPYMALKSACAEAEERAYRIRRDIPTRGTVRKAVWPLAEQLDEERDQATWIGAEMALHFALVGLTTRDLIGEHDLGLLAGPFLIGGLSAGPPA